MSVHILHIHKEYLQILLVTKTLSAPLMFYHFVCLHSEWGTEGNYSDSVPGLARPRRSRRLHWFSGLCGTGTDQTGWTGPADGGALQVRGIFLWIVWHAEPAVLSLIAWNLFLATRKYFIVKPLSHIYSQTFQTGLLPRKMRSYSIARPRF